jgi:hypothetical protein
MRELLILAIHLVVTFAKLLRPGGVRAVAAEALLLKHQLLITNRSRHRAEFHDARSRRARSDHAVREPAPDCEAGRAHQACHQYSTLWWNLHAITCYLRNNTPFLVNYGARYRKGLPISISIPESAVNQVVSLRMAKKRQMRWTDAGAHRLVRVRVAVLNGELSPSRLARLGNASNTRPRKMPSAATQALAASRSPVTRAAS